jgi:hypothetical protein
VREAEDLSIALHGLTRAARARLHRDLPDRIAPALRSVQLAAETAREPVGALGHLAHARAQLDAILAAAEKELRHA